MTKKEHIMIKVEGMTCTNCAVGVTKSLQKANFENIHVDFATGEVQLDIATKKQIEEAKKQIRDLGYKVIENQDSNIKEGISSIEKKFLFTLPFSLFLLLHMFLPFDFLHNALIQLIVCLPVFILGLYHFGRSAWKSLIRGMPNMDVLITIGNISAFGYSLAGTIMYYGTPQIDDFLFYETASTIITLVLLGNALEARSVKQTTTAIKELTEMQVKTAKKVITQDGNEIVKEVHIKELNKGDIVIVNTGDKIPVDGIVNWGIGDVDEAMITGENIPSTKNIGDSVIGGTIVVSGNLKVRAEKIGSESTLANIIKLVKEAQASKPSIQRLGDNVSGVFVPLVIGVAMLTFGIWYFIVDQSLQQSIMNSVAVLVISCPCAMGLATPTAVMVGLGRAAKNGILIKGGEAIENLTKIKTIVFDKTGTLTTGKLSVDEMLISEGFTKNEVIRVLVNMEQHSSHPIALSIVAGFKNTPVENIKWKKINEHPGIGLEAVDEEDNSYKSVSYKGAEKITRDDSWSVYVIKNEKLMATIRLKDTIKSQGNEVINFFNEQDIETILLSGDSKENCDKVANDLGIKTVYSQKKPEEKTEIIKKYKDKGGIAMVGDGINDAPALAHAGVGISISGATQIAIQSAQVILLDKKNFNKLTTTFKISKHTLLTIKQNLFWAFFYNIIAIPFAALGYLNPMIAALAMAFSDVMVIGNSIRLKYKNLK